MASRIISRHRILNRALSHSQLCSISSSTGSSIFSRFCQNTFSHLVLQSLFAASIHVSAPFDFQSIRFLSTSRDTTSSLKDPNPNWSNRPPKETILLDGCDFEHWLVVVEKPEGDPTREEIIDSYIKTLAMVVGSEEEARMKIYSVSTRCYFAFGALVSEELSYKIKELPKVRWVLPDSYLDVRNKDYGGEPFINGEAVPYHPKYHEEWIRNHNQAMERNRRKDRQRNFDRSRNFERRRDNMPGYDSEFPIPRSTTAPPPPPPPPNYAPPPPPYGGPGMAPNMRPPPPPPPPPYNTAGGMSSGPTQTQPGGFQQQYNRGMPQPQPPPTQYGPPGGQRPNDYSGGGSNPGGYGAAPRPGQWPNTDQGSGPGQWQPQYGGGDGGMWRGHGGVQPMGQPTGQPVGQPMGQPTGRPMGQPMGGAGWGDRGPGRDGFAQQNGGGGGEVIENNRGEASG